MRRCEQDRRTPKSVSQSTRWKKNGESGGNEEENAQSKLEQKQTRTTEIQVGDLVPVPDSSPTNQPLLRVHVG